MDIEWKWTDGWMDGWIKVNGIWAMNELVTILWFPEIRNYIPLCKWGTQIEYTLKHNTFCPSTGRVHFFTIATYSAGSIGRLIGYIRWSELGHILRHTRHPTWSQFVTGSLENKFSFVQVSSWFYMEGFTIFFSGRRFKSKNVFYTTFHLLWPPLLSAPHSKAPLFKGMHCAVHSLLI